MMRITKVMPQLNGIFAALADPTRRAILARLSRGSATVSELKAPFTLTQPAISKHLKVLEQAGLISRSRDAQRRPCLIEGSALRLAHRWLYDFHPCWEPATARPVAPAARHRLARRSR